MKDLKEEIGFEDVMKVDIRIGVITNAERIPKSDKLLKMTVDFYGVNKQCVTNLGEHLEPDVFFGVKAPFVMNMPSRKMMGVETEVMICVGMDEGILHLDIKDYTIGAKLL